jgi:hypothetical protein
MADLVVTKLETRRRRLGRSKSWLRVETASGRIGRVREGQSAALGEAVLE